MRKLAAFIQVSLDGYFADADGGIGWAHKDPGDGEWNAFVADNAKGGGQLLFGRITYEFMASYWPTPMAAEQNPVVAERMNSMPKIVFSRTLDEAAWANTTLVNGDLVAEVRKLKKDAGPDMAILGSGSIVSQLARGRIDRRIPDRGESDRAGQRQRAVRRHQGQPVPEAHEHAQLRQRQRLSALRAGGIELHDRRMSEFPEIITHNYDPARGACRNLCALAEAARGGGSRRHQGFRANAPSRPTTCSADWRPRNG